MRAALGPKSKILNLDQLYFASCLDCLIGLPWLFWIFHLCYLFSMGSLLYITPCSRWSRDYTQARGQVHGLGQTRHDWGIF
jgi:hypothetical protein